MSQVKITVRKNGSLRVDDPTALSKWWTPMATSTNLTGKTAFSLCRCGALRQPALLRR